MEDSKYISKARVSLSLGYTLKDRIKALAKKNNDITLGEMIVTILERYVEFDEKKAIHEFYKENS